MSDDTQTAPEAKATKAELAAKAKDLEIVGRAAMSKDELAEAVVEAETVVDTGFGVYELGSWAGQPNYCCRQCEGAFLSELEILSHLQTQHPILPPWARPSPILGPDGEPLMLADQEV